MLRQKRHQAVRRLFRGAVQLPPAQRESWLRDCGEEEEVIEETRRLLEFHQEPFRESSEGPSDQSTRSLWRDSTADVADPDLEIAPDPPGRTGNPATALPGRGTTRVQPSRHAGLAMLLGRRPFVLALLGLIAVVLLTGFWIDRSLRRATEQRVRWLTQSILAQQTEAIDMWLEAEFRLARSWTQSGELVGLTERAPEAVPTRGAYGNPTLQPEIASEDLEVYQEFDRTIRQLARGLGDVRYSIWDRQGRLAVCNPTDWGYLGNGPTDHGAALIARVLRGNNELWLPSSEGYMTEGYVLSQEFDKPRIALLVPIHAPGDPQPIGVLKVGGEEMHDRFQRVLRHSWIGTSGETYVVDSRGFMVSQSRFSNHLVSLGWLPERRNGNAGATGMIRVTVPPVNTYEQSPPRQQLDSWPLTESTRLVTSGVDGQNTVGYPDYRGIMVVGAWRWLETYRFGLITEVDLDAAYEDLRPLRVACLILLGATLTIGTATMFYQLKVSRQNARDPIERRIGPYLVAGKIGEGGLATVHLATHDLLQRPAALKKLKPQHATAANISRFEREVRIASQLRHPNTIEIYDYGQTPRGIWYCAMEHINGLTLQQVMRIEGRQPPARVVHILIQTCRSLREAHDLGFIHRDIKPQNIMLYSCGQEDDCVKVLDFGLARPMDASLSRATETRVLVGTPMYIAPERILRPEIADAKTDIFSLGVLAHVLLTNREPHEAFGSMESLQLTLRTDPPLPSSMTSHPIPEELDRLVQACQFRSPGDRPADINTILTALFAIAEQHPWNAADAMACWHPLTHSS